MSAVGSALVVGGGPAGMTAAIALARAGVEVELAEIEKDWRPAGIGLLLQPSPLRALRRLGLYDECRAVGFVHPVIRFCDAAGALLYAAETPELDGELLHPLGIGRPALHAILERALRDAGVSVRLGTTVAALKDDGAGIDVELTDGGRGRYGLVVGADGVHSAIRRRIFPAAPEPIRAGQKIWRAKAPRPPRLDHYPIFFGASGKVGLVPIAEDHIYLFVLQPGEAETPRPAQPLLAGQLAEQLTGYNDVVDEVRDSFDPDTVECRSLVALLLPPPWHRGRVLLVGDAAHATTPHLAYGVGIAIEDALVLAELVAGGGPVPELLDHFADRRYERARLIVEGSLQLSRWETSHVPGADPGTLLNTTFQKMAEPF